MPKHCTTKMVPLLCMGLVGLCWMIPATLLEAGVIVKLSSDDSDAGTPLQLPSSLEVLKKKKLLAEPQPEGAPEGTAPSPTPPEQQQQPGAAQAQQPMMPLPPTQTPDPFGLPPQGTPPTEYGPVPPTAFGPPGTTPTPGQPGPGQQAGPGQQQAPGGGAMMPSPYGPHQAPPTPTPSASAGAAGTDPKYGRYAAYAVPQATGELDGPRRPTSLPSAAGQKPFSGYEPPPTLSPYMNLYRDPVGGIDNYNALVRPVIEERRRAQSVQHELNRLRRAASVQGRNINQLERRTNPYQRRAASPNSSGQQPAMFMNYNNYYPGFGKR